MEGFTILDIIITALLLFFVIRGYTTGFIRQTSTILGLLIALLVAIKQYESFQVYLEPYFNVSPSMQQFLSFAIIFLVFNIGIHILGTILKRLIDLLFLEPVDHLAGAALGLIKGGVLVYLIVFILDEIPVASVVEIVDSSYLAVGILENITPFVQENLQNIFGHS